MHQNIQDGRTQATKPLASPLQAPGRQILNFANHDYLSRIPWGLHFPVRKRAMAAAALTGAYPRTFTSEVTGRAERKKRPGEIIMDRSARSFQARFTKLLCWSAVLRQLLCFAQ